ncbi:MAG: tetratricopeptide repeat protein, partial [Blastocatellia bacterium]
MIIETISRIVALSLLCCCANLSLAQRKPAPSAIPPGGIQTLYQKAREAEARKDYKEAAAIYETILAQDPSLHPLRANLGMMQFLDGDYAAAARSFEQVLKAGPTLYTAKLFLGISQLEMNQPDLVAPALRHLEGAVKE